VGPTCALCRWPRSRTPRAGEGQPHGVPRLHVRIQHHARLAPRQEPQRLGLLSARPPYPRPHTRAPAPCLRVGVTHRAQECTRVPLHRVRGLGATPKAQGCSRVKTLERLSVGFRVRIARVQGMHRKHGRHKMPVAGTFPHHANIGVHKFLWVRPRRAKVDEVQGPGLWVVQKLPQLGSVCKGVSVKRKETGKGSLLFTPKLPWETWKSLLVCTFLFTVQLGSPSRAPSAGVCWWWWWSLECGVWSVECVEFHAKFHAEFHAESTATVMASATWKALLSGT